MMRLFVITTALLCLAPAAQAQDGPVVGIPGNQATLCLARIDDRGTVQVRHLSGTRSPDQEIVIKKRNDKGGEVDVKLVVSRQTVDEQMTTVHVSGVQLFDMEGKMQDAKKLPALLKQERPVLVFQGKPTAKYLAGFKKDLPVLVLPAIDLAPALEPLPLPLPPEKAPQRKP